MMDQMRFRRTREYRPKVAQGTEGIRFQLKCERTSVCLCVTWMCSPVTLNYRDADRTRLRRDVRKSNGRMDEFVSNCPPIFSHCRHISTVSHVTVISFFYARHEFHKRKMESTSPLKTNITFPRLTRDARANTSTPEI